MQARLQEERAACLQLRVAIRIEQERVARVGQQRFCSEPGPTQLPGIARLNLMD